MANTPQAFTRRVKDREVPREDRTIEFVLRTEDEDENGNTIIVREDKFTASLPTEEQLLLLFALGGNSNATAADETAAMFDVFKSVLPANQYKKLMNRFKDPNDPDVDAEAIADIFEWLLEQWQDFPTTPPSASATSPSASGPRSTGRARGKGSTR